MARSSPEANNHDAYEVLVVGAGVTGCAAAVTLARQGRRVLLLERDLRAPDRIVGELLQPGGVAALRALGLAHCLDDIGATPVRGYRLIYFGDEVTFWYPPAAKYPIWEKTANGDSKTNAKRHEGRSFRNGRFVANLRQAASREDNVRIVEASVTTLLWSQDGTAVVGAESRCRSTGQVRRHSAPLTIVADGQASNLRPQLSKETPVVKSRFWGLELIDADLGSYGLSLGVVGNSLPLGIYQIGKREIRMLIDIPIAPSIERLGLEGTKELIRSNVIPALPENLQGATERALSEGRVRSMPNSWLPPVSSRVAGVCLLGDAYNMRHPMAGSGMTVGLHDVVILTRALDRRKVPLLSDLGAVQKQVAEFKRERRKYNLTLNMLAQILYCLAAAADDDWRMFQRGFLGYIDDEEKNLEELSGLIGGVIPDPWLLSHHLAAVAVYSMRLHLRESYAVSVWSLPAALLKCFVASIKAICVVAPYILPELLA